ncbi:MAG TPA: hypothetical protein VFE57_07605 [Cyclobacteriaceae bacterium]|jgi:hypothetical protein|nr:hypothetical protein [Cyclobacteriaceae bacterium]
MSYKPDESTLISYLYGELGDAERDKVQRYLNENPEAAKAMQQHSEVLDHLGNVHDKEVIAPPIFAESEKHVSSFWHHGPFKTTLGIAASLLLIMVAGKFMGTDIHYSNGELKISFGGSKTVHPVLQAQALSPEQVQQMINSSLVKNNEVVTANLSDNQKKLDQTIKNNLAMNSMKLDGLMKDVSQASQDQVRSFVAGLQNENGKTMREYMQLSASEQNKYMESLLVDFTKYLNEQRSQDLQLFQSRISVVEENTDQFKQETEQILSSIINTGATESKKQNSY